MLVISGDMFYVCAPGKRRESFELENKKSNFITANKVY